jgi:hypothetical protein
MTKVAVLVGVVAVAVFATAALSGNAGVKQGAGEQAARAVSLQKQVNELRNELICLATVTGNGVAADAFWAQEATGSPKPETPVDDRGVCKKLGVTVLGTTPTPGGMAQPFSQVVRRAFG